MTVWTIYNHGTGGSSLKSAEKAEIVNLFGNRDPRQEFVGKIITEGVGSIGDPEKIKHIFDRDPGSGPITVTKAPSSGSSALMRAINAGLGWGVKENVDSTVELIRMLNLNNNKPDAINMLGWSRGAVTCIRIAWKLFQSQDPVLRNIPINIFAVDPVAGAGHSTEVDATTLTPNVKNYLATLATGEKRRFFKPIAGHRLSVTDPSATRVWVLPVPGHHSDTAKANNNVGKIVFNLAQRFLGACYTPVPAMNQYRLRNQDAWQAYEEIMVGSAKVHSTNLSSKLAMGGIGYTRSAEVAAHSFGEMFFPNIHARQLFADVYPFTYNAYFGNGRTMNIHSAGWHAQYGSRVENEQTQLGMSSAMIERLQAFAGAAGSEPPLTAEVALMLHNLNLMD